MQGTGEGGGGEDGGAVGRREETIMTSFNSLSLSHPLSLSLSLSLFLSRLPGRDWEGMPSLKTASHL